MWNGIQANNIVAILAIMELGDLPVQIYMCLLLHIACLVRFHVWFVYFAWQQCFVVVQMYGFKACCGAEGL